MQEPLAVEGGVDDEPVLATALLHDTAEDTETTPYELREAFGEGVAAMVLEVTDDKSLPRTQRKRLQVEHASGLSRGAKPVKLADKICNLRDMAGSPPDSWSLPRRQEYFDWAKSVVGGPAGGPRAAGGGVRRGVWGSAGAGAGGGSRRRGGKGGGRSLKRRRKAATPGTHSGSLLGYDE